MKINIFYEDYRDKEMDILKITDQSILSTVKAYLFNKGVEWTSIVWGKNIWGYEWQFDFHVYKRKPSTREVSIVSSLFPSSEDGGNTKIEHHGTQQHGTQQKANSIL